MTRLQILLLGALLLCCPRLAWGQACPEAVPLATGDYAGCDGILVPDVWVRDALLCLEVDLERCRVEGGAALRSMEIRHAECRKELEITADSYRQMSAMVDRAAAASRPTPWYRDPWVTGVIGFVAGAVGTVTVINLSN